MKHSIRSQTDETQDPSMADGPLSEEDAFEAFLSLETEDAPEDQELSDEGEERDSPDEEVEDASEDTEDTDEEADEENDDESADEEAEDGEEETEEGEEASEVEDDAVVEIKVGDTTEKVHVKDLKRLYGQEAALTQKSQKASQTQKNAEAREEMAQEVLKKLHEAAVARYKEFEDLNLVELAASGKYAREDILAAQQGMSQAYQEMQYFNTSLEEFQSAKERASQEELKDKATEALKVIQDDTSEYHIEDFEGRYQSLVKFATEKAGIPEAVLNTTADPWLWKLLDNNARYMEARKKATDPTEKKVKKTGGKKILKSKRRSRDGAKEKGDRRTNTMERLRSNPNSEDAAINAFLALEDDAS